MKREALLRRLRTRLGHTAGAPVPPAPHPSPAPVSSAASDDPATRFVARLEELGVAVTRTLSRDEAQRAIDSLIAERGWRAICAPRTLRWLRVDDVWVDDPRVAEFGLAEADWALAETGTVVLLNRGEAARPLAAASGLGLPRRPVAHPASSGRCVAPSWGGARRPPRLRQLRERAEQHRRHQRHALRRGPRPGRSVRLAGR